jgi:hypothetical protein
MQLINPKRTKKFFQEFFLQKGLGNILKFMEGHMEKIYHIYAKDRCLFHSIKEEEFKTTWKTLTNMVGIMKTDYSVDDLSYEELMVNRKVSLDSSH